MKEKEYFVHESAVVDDGATIGKDTKIWHFSHIYGGAKIGERCVLGQNVMVDDEVVLGDGCKIQNNVSLYKPVVLEENVFCGPSCVFTNVKNPRAFINRKSEFLETRVKKGAAIGANATIVCGVTLGCFCFIGAGALVTRDVKDYELILGVPGRSAGWMCECGLRLNEVAEGEAASCECGKSYFFEKGILKQNE
jgi:UDP-2-acetamido-3-amino-2,3-dideoxy-glucuronate N-acetyltransferase